MNPKQYRRAKYISSALLIFSLFIAGIICCAGILLLPKDIDEYDYLLPNQAKWVITKDFDFSEPVALKEKTTTLEHFGVHEIIILSVYLDTNQDNIYELWLVHPEAPYTFVYDAKLYECSLQIDYQNSIVVLHLNSLGC